MTKQAPRYHWFNEWLQNDPELESNSNKFFATDIDFLMSRRKDGRNLWMFLEIKGKNGKMTKGQFYDFNRLHKSIRHSDYRGFHIIQWSNPLDNPLKDRREMTVAQLRQFFLFNGPAEWYSEGPKD